MKISTKGRFAVTAMMELALRQDYRPVTLAEISTEQDISISYLEQLFAKLRKNSLVKGMRGPGGGYTLARPANEITIAEIITAVDEKAYSPLREDAILPADKEQRAAQILWDALSTRIYGFLNSLTLDEICKSADLGEAFLSGDKAA
jgi:Rrf2 family iron-sulfur cluster assembly transcriptional regulator